MRFLSRTDRDFSSFGREKITALSHENEQQESATTSDFPCSVNREAAGQQLLASSAGIIIIIIIIIIKSYTKYKYDINHKNITHQEIQMESTA